MVPAGLARAAAAQYRGEICWLRELDLVEAEQHLAAGKSITHALSVEALPNG
jgi:hypothetical protein